MMNHVNSQIKNRRRNAVIARGKIINIEHNEDYSYLKLFIRNGAGLRHTYLTFRYDPKIFYISKNQYVIITAHIENKQNSFGGVDQFIIIDSISESQSELSEHFFDNQKKLGFSHPKSYAKCYVYGKVIHKFEKNNSNWIELIVKDNFDFTVKLQYSKKMRVSDINYDVGDNLFIYALIISSEKTINQKKRSYFNLIVEDMINKTNLK